MNNESGSFQDVARVLRALSDKHRLRMVDLLSRDKLSVNDLVRSLDLLQSNVSRHLQVLHNAGLLNRRKVGTAVFYSLSHPETIDVIASASRIVENRVGAIIALK